MDTPTNQSENTASPFLPVFLLALSGLIFFTWQFVMVWKQQSGLKAAQESRRQVITALEQNEKSDQLRLSQAVQDELQKLAVGLLDLARAGDPDAIALQQKYGIAQSQPAAGTPAPAPKQ